jgi:hypothetical protein
LEELEEFEIFDKLMMMMMMIKLIWRRSFRSKKKGGICDRQTIKRVSAMKKTC